jgi:hypothetical protein
MEQLLERISQLEKRVQMLEKRDTTNELNDFKETIKLISVSTENLINVFNTSMDQEIVNILIKTNTAHNFLQYKKHVYKFENDNMIKMEDSDYKYMFEYIEYSILKLFNSYSSTLKSDEYYEKYNIVYGLKFDKNVKKIKSLFLESL